MGESLSSAAINQNTSVFINFGNVHRRTFHFRIGESKLDVNIIDALEKIGEESTSGLNSQVVSEEN
jgi:hypothetical protein